MEDKICLDCRRIENEPNEEMIYEVLSSNLSSNGCILLKREQFVTTYLSGVIVNKLMRESRARFVILHLAPVFFTDVLVTIYTRPFAVLDIIHPKGILHVVVPLILVLAQTLKSIVVSNNIKLIIHKYNNLIKRFFIRIQ